VVGVVQKDGQSLVMPMAQLRAVGPLGWAVFGLARADKSALS